MQRNLRRSVATPTPPVVPRGISGPFCHQDTPQTTQGVRRVTSSSPERASQLRRRATVAPVDSNLPDNECIVCRSAGNEDNDAEVALKTPTEVCTHPPQVCMGCLQQVILAAVTSGDFIAGIPCPLYGCPRRMGYHDVQKWATKEVFDRYDALLLQDLLRTDGRYVFCVRLGCTAGQEHTTGNNNNIVTCYHCEMKQCFRHQVPWHEGLTCEQLDKQQRTTTEQERKTEDWIQVGTKACPGAGCGRRIQKSSGCDHMTCKRPGGCGHQFCWECLAPWLQIMLGDNSRHYDNCKYYSGLPGKNPAPPEIVTARTVLVQPPPLIPSIPAPPEGPNPVFSQSLPEVVLPQVTRRREPPPRPGPSRTTEISAQGAISATTPSATPASSHAEPSGSSRMPTIPITSADAKHYSGRPGENPTPPEILATRDVLVQPSPFILSIPAPPEAPNPVFSQSLPEVVLPQVTRRCEPPPRPDRSASRTTENLAQPSIPTATPNATPASSHAESSRSSRMPTIPITSAGAFTSYARGYAYGYPYPWCIYPYGYPYPMWIYPYWPLPPMFMYSSPFAYFDDSHGRRGEEDSAGIE